MLPTLEAQTKDILIKGSLENTQQPRGSTSCRKPRCKTCDHIQQGDTIVKQEETYPIRGSFTCQSKNVISIYLKSDHHSDFKILRNNFAAAAV